MQNLAEETTEDRMRDRMREDASERMKVLPLLIESHTKLTYQL